MCPKRKATGSLDNLSKSKQPSLGNKENQPADPNSAEASVARSSKSRPRTSTNAVQESDNTVSIMSSASQEPPRTPERPSRPMLSHSHSSHSSHSSSVKVSGHKVNVNAKFSDSVSTGVCKVDKTLVCNTFWESVKDIGKICLPRRSGKTYNLTLLLLFFSSCTEYEDLINIPDSVLESREIDAEQIARMSLAEKCRAKREQLFSGSLLKTNHPEFYREHFMKHPVISISFATCMGTTFIRFIVNLCEVISMAAEKWLMAYDAARSDANQVNHTVVVDLRTAIDSFKAIRYDAESHARKCEFLVNGLFKHFSAFVCSQFGQYILLVDEYDIPLVTIDVANWDTDTKIQARGIVKELYTHMFKVNKHIGKGLVVGVFDFPMTDLGSGVNNIEPIRTIPRVEDEVVASSCYAEYPDSFCGLDNLADLFWFNTDEIELILDQNVERHPSIREHRSFIMDTIKVWYNGYRIGCFSGKYNPWSIMSFISRLFQKLGKGFKLHTVEEMRQITKSAAISFWVETGSTGHIEAQLEKHRIGFADLAKRLITEYDYFKNGPQSSLEERPIPVPQPNVTPIRNIRYDDFTKPGLLNLCLYAGYLTRREGVNVCIPNHEVYQVWRDLFTRAAVGDTMAESGELHVPGALLQELFGGRTDYLVMLIRQTHSVLSNHGNYLERDYANFVACALMVATLTGLLTHPKQDTVDPSHVIVYREAQAGNGRCDYALRLFGTDNQPNHFGVIIEFKLIPNARTNDPECCKQLAATALDQISKKYAMLLSGCLERMDIGMAVGFNTVYTKCRSFMRPTDDGNWTEVDNLINKTPIEQSS